MKPENRSQSAYQKIAELCVRYGITKSQNMTEQELVAVLAALAKKLKDL